MNAIAYVWVDVVVVIVFRSIKVEVFELYSRRRFVDIWLWMLSIWFPQLSESLIVKPMILEKFCCFSC